MQIKEVIGATSSGTDSSQRCSRGIRQAKKTTTFSELAAYVAPDREQILLAGAKNEGKVVWYTSLAGGSYKALVEAFEAKYPDVKVEL